MKVSTVEKMRDLDRRAVEEYGIGEDLLMENAGFVGLPAAIDRSQ